MIHRHAVGKREILLLSIIERFPGLIAREIVVHVIVDRVFVFFGLLDFFGLLRSALFCRGFLFRGLFLLLRNFQFLFKAFFQKRVHFELCLDLLFKGECGELQHLEVLNLLRRQLHQHLMLEGDV
jgi:hypothetical protein